MSKNGVIDRKRKGRTYLGFFALARSDVNTVACMRLYSDICVIRVVGKKSEGTKNSQSLILNPTRAC